MVTIRTSQYVFSHGREPRGWGMWVFEIDGERFCHAGKYSDAKKSAVAMARVRNATTVTVMP